jgi:hypothetical protein
MVSQLVGAAVQSLIRECFCFVYDGDRLRGPPNLILEYLCDCRELSLIVITIGIHIRHTLDSRNINRISASDRNRGDHLLRRRIRHLIL